MLEILRSCRVKVLRHIPKAARVQFRICLNECLEQATTTNDATTWLRLLLLPAAVLRNDSTLQGMGGSLATKVKRRLAAFTDASSIHDVLQMARKSVMTVKPNKPNKPKRDRTAALVAEKISDGDVKGAIRLACSDDSIAPYDAETLAVLLQKHPRRDANGSGDWGVPDRQALEFSADDIITAIRKFNPSSSSGLSMWRPQHLMDLVRGDVANTDVRNLVQRLKQLVGLMVNSRVPELIRPVVYGANLIALRKKDGGIRPIAVGETFRRLAAKCALAQVRESMVSHLSPLQVGFGVPGGAEAAVHAARSILQHGGQDDVMLKVDFANAFNSIHRSHVYAVVRRLCPQLANFVCQCYSSASFLAFGDDTISSEEGLQQGDPLAPLLFCLGIHEELQQLHCSAIVGYLDDITLFGPRAEVSTCFRQLSAACQRFGLHCNESKCEVATWNDSDVADATLAGLNRVLNDELTLLGGALGHSSLERLLSSHVDRLTLLDDRLQQLNAHDALFIIRHSIAIPKLLFHLRTSPCFRVPELLSKFDSKLRETLEAVLNTRLQDQQWAQATLPVRHGGVGIFSTADLASAAFAASQLSTAHLATAIARNAPIASAASEATAQWSNTTALECPLSSRQSAWTQPIHQLRFNNLLSAADELNRARLQGCSAPGAGAWLNCLPSSSLGLRLSNEQLRVAVSLRLGSPVCLPHRCQCGAEADSHGLHALSCRRSRGRHARHSLLNDVISRACQSALIPVIKEPTGLSSTDGKRPDGVTLIPWSRGKPLAWDATCVHRLALSWRQASTATGTPAADSAESRKCEKYLFLHPDVTFQPVAVETLGGMGTSTRKFIKELGKRLATTLQEPREAMYLKQRLAIAIQLGNAASVLETFKL